MHLRTMTPESQLIGWERFEQIFVDPAILAL
jgi:hypothetical protein